MAESALSWQEVQDICGEMEKLYRKDAQKDAQRLRTLTQKRKQIAATIEGKQNESKKQLQRMCVCFSSCAIQRIRQWLAISLRWIVLLA